MMKSKNAQSLSIDILIGAMAFLILIGIVYYASTRSSNLQDGEALQSNALKISTVLEKGDNLAVIDQDNSLSLDELEELYSKSPDELRREFGINSKFCIYVEDSNGNILWINNKNGVGDPEIIIGGKPCGTEKSG